MIQTIIFILVTVVAFYFAYHNFMKVRRNIFLGKDEKIGGNETARWKNVLLVAFGQRKMFKRWIPAVLHFFIYAAFLLTQIELIEIFVDGFFGVHRFFAPYLGGFYTFMISFIEILSVLALVATIIFLARRNLLKLPRFQKAEMTLWPKLDANLILFGELALIFGILSMNSADIMLQQLDPLHYPDTGRLAISSFLGPLLFSGWDQGALMLVERFGWWLHIITVLAFLNYLPFSKHFHIFLAFPNTWYARLKPQAEMNNMPEIMHEVKSMMGLGNTEDTGMPPDDEIPEFGASDVFSMSWKNIMDAYSCTECGRCTAVCPANITGKKLSPRKIMMDIRDRAEEVGRHLDEGHLKWIAADKRESASRLTKENYDDGKSLFDYITPEELHACTTCNACVEACPVLINPLEPILKMRRYEILTLSAGPADWVPMFTSIENSGSPWQIPDDRDKWAQDALVKNATDSSS